MEGADADANSNNGEGLSWRSAPSEHPDVCCQSPGIKEGLAGIEFGCNSALRQCVDLSCW